MPGFYKHYEGYTEWKNFAALPGLLEFSFSDADILFKEIIPKITSSCIAEGCDPYSIEYIYSVCIPVSGNKYGQVCAIGKSKQLNK